MTYLEVPEAIGSGSETWNLKIPKIVLSRKFSQAFSDHTIPQFQTLDLASALWQHVSNALHSGITTAELLDDRNFSTPL